MRLIRFLLAMSCLCIVLGCSTQGRFGVNVGGEVHGKVTIDGVPVTAGDVFMVSADKQHSASGAIRGDGTYSVKEPPLGETLIAIQTMRFRGMNLKGGSESGRPTGPGSAGMVLPDASERGLVYVRIPPKYESEESSNLTYKVPAGKSQHDLPLSWK